MTDLVRFHVFYQAEFDEDLIGTGGAVAKDFQTFSVAKKEAQRLFAGNRKPLLVTQTNPRRRRGHWHQVRMRLG